jgi:hypothetical protein
MLEEHPYDVEKTKRLFVEAYLTLDVDPLRGAVIPEAYDRERRHPGMASRGPTARAAVS